MEAECFFFGDAVLRKNPMNGFMTFGSRASTQKHPTDLLKLGFRDVKEFSSRSSIE